MIAIWVLTASNWSREVCAQGAAELASLRTQVGQLYNRRRFAEAAPIAERYVVLARQAWRYPTEHAAAIPWLANVCRGQGRYPEAELL
jgi:hypothetical protein